MNHTLTLITALVLAPLAALHAADKTLHDASSPIQRPALLLGPAAALHAAAKPAERPNIVFLLSDDHASQSIGCYGGKLMQTPNLDRIARGG